MRSIMVCKWDEENMADEAEWINTEDIVFSNRVTTKKEKHGFIIYRTANGLYRNFTSIDKEHALLAKEDGFIRTDRGVIANLKMSPSLDEKNRLLVFNIENENDGNDFVTIADNKLDVVKGYLKKLFSSKK